MELIVSANNPRKRKNEEVYKEEEVEERKKKNEDVYKEEEVEEKNCTV